MTDLLKLLTRHKGKATLGTTLAAVLYLCSRGCDVSVHVQPIQARTNDVPAEVTP